MKISGGKNCSYFFFWRFFFFSYFQGGIIFAWILSRIYKSNEQFFPKNCIKNPRFDFCFFWKKLGSKFYENLWREKLQLFFFWGFFFSYFQGGEESFLPESCPGYIKVTSNFSQKLHKKTHALIFVFFFCKPSQWEGSWWRLRKRDCLGGCGAATERRGLRCKITHPQKTLKK